MPTTPPARLLPLLAVLAALAGAGPAAALELRSVQVQGLDDEEMHDNVDDALSLQRLNPARRRVLTESRLSWLLRKAPAEARRALEPFGYYDPKIDAQVRRDGDAVDVIVVVDPGEPVRVTASDVDLLGPARDESGLMRRLQRFRPRMGEPFHHGRYEDNKAGVDRALLELGYFDAEQTVHEVTVNRAGHSAAIALAWSSGERYAFGEANFSGHQFRPGLLENLVPWTPGEPFDQALLLALHVSLSELDYFGAVEIRSEPDAADDSRRVPVQVVLSPGKRDVFSAGLRYGTDTGIGVNTGFERRWLNDRGHKFRAEASLAQRRNDISAQYRIPAFAWLDGWYTVGASARQEEIDGVDSELVEFIGSRSGRLDDWALTASLNVRRERYEDVTSGFEQAYSTVVFPSLLAQWSQSDDVLYPREARGLTVELRGGHSAIGSDVDFLQLRAEGRWIHTLSRGNRLLMRAEAGTTYSDQFEDFPPSLRFYAGGDRSVRGYGYKEIGEYVFDSDGDRFVFGGKHLVVASVEYERMFNRTWGGAVFVDAGDAFDDFDSFSMQPGVGFGVRWRSPVGPVRLDLAHGFGDDAQDSIRLHLNIGPDL